MPKRSFGYDPAAGNLLLNFEWTGSAVTNGLLHISGSYSTRLIGSGSSTTQYRAFNAANTGAATEFNVTPELLANKR